MLEIIICEDNKKELHCLNQLLEKNLPDFFPDYHISSFSSGHCLLEALRQKPLSASLFLLDIYLEDITGIEIAEYIRSQSREAQIIFLTSSREFIMESYDLDALYYIVKPVTAQRLVRALEKAAEALGKRSSDFLFIKDHTQMRLPQESIQYVETFGNRSYIHTEQETFVIYKSLKDISLQLSEDSFLLIQRGILTNMNYIDSMQKNLCTLKNGKSYQLSRKNSGVLKEKYFEWLFHKRA